MVGTSLNKINLLGFRILIRKSLVLASNAITDFHRELHNWLSWKFIDNSNAETESVWVRGGYIYPFGSPILDK
jgi:hypothetical protein